MYHLKWSLDQVAALTPGQTVMIYEDLVEQIDGR